MNSEKGTAAEPPGAPELRLVVCGLKRRHRDLLVQLGSRWRTLVLDNLETPVPDWFPIHDKLSFQPGEASSLLVWQRLNLSRLLAVISVQADPAFNRELCHILYERLGLRPRFFIVAEDHDPETNGFLKERYGARLISPATLAREMLFNQLLTRTVLPLNIGLGKGEILEVEISARSHLVDRPLRYLRPREWHIAAIYRRGELLLPTGEVSLQVGDRVVLAGDPTVLANLAEALLQGEPQFPRPYGAHATMPLLDGWEYVLDELAVWARRCRIKRINLMALKRNFTDAHRTELEEKAGREVHVGTQAGLRDFFTMVPADSGLLVLPKRGRAWKRLFRIADGSLTMPVLLAGGQSAYSKVVAGLDGEWPGLVLDIALDLSRILALPLEAYYTHQAWEIGGDDSLRNVQVRERLIRDLSTIHGLNLPLHGFSGNPVSVASDWLGEQKNPLLVISYRPGEYAAWFLSKPVLAPLLCDRYRGSVLLVPLPYGAEPKP